MNQEIIEYIKAGKKQLIVVYIMYLCGIVAPLLAIIGAVFSYIHRNNDEKFLSTHYLFLFYTFVYGASASILHNLLTLIPTTSFTMFLINVILYTCIIAWFLLRVTIGLRYLISNLPHPNPDSKWLY